MLFFHGLNVVCVGFIAAYRGEMYHFPAPAWALSATAGLLGLIAPLGVPAHLRRVLLAGSWPLVFVVPLAGLLLSPHVFPSPVSVGPFFFCVGASLTTCVVVLRNISRRKRSIRRSLEHPDTLPPQLDARFAGYAALFEEASSRSKALQQALRAQAWVSTKKRRLRAAALLREWADFVEQADQTSSGHMRHAVLAAATRLENGGRVVRWRRWLRSLSAQDFDADRDEFYALDRLAHRQGVTPPRWLRAMCRQLARGPLTERDVTPPWNLAAPLGKALTAMVAVIVVASVVLSTATAQTPLDDSRPLPVIAGVSAASHIEPRLSRVTHVLAGRQAEARCWSEEDWERLTAQRTSWINGSQRRLGRWGAYASGDHERANFSPAICASLARLLDERIPVQRDRWPAALAWSVAALAHEAQHLSGIHNEAKAECYGMQWITVATRELGRTYEEGRYLAELYWEGAYRMRHNRTYTSAECRDGGRLDLRPAIHAWP